MATSAGEKLRRSIPVATLGVGVLALFAGVEWWWAVFVVGWLLLTPLADIVFDAEDDHGAGERAPGGGAATGERTPAGETRATGRRSPSTGGTESTADALDRLRERYADGELTEEQFERKVERLLETETVEDAREYAGADGAGAGVGATTDLDGSALDDPGGSDRPRTDDGGSAPGRDGGTTDEGRTGEELEREYET